MSNPLGPRAQIGNDLHSQECEEELPGDNLQLALLLRGQMPPPTYRLAATTCLSLTSVRRRVSDDRPNARHEVALIETEFLREVAMSKKAYRLTAVIRSPRPSGVACPNT